MTHSPRGVRRRRSSTSPDTIVAVLANDHDLHYFLDKRSYRIPDRVLGRALARNALENARYLALYQSHGVNDGLPGAIEWWGKIREICSLRRREIFPDEQDHTSADELYHVITLGRRRRRNPPLRSRLPRRFAFIRTTRERFLTATDIGELPLGSPTGDSLVEAVAERSEGIIGPGGVDLGGNRFVEINDVGMEIDVDLVEESAEETEEGDGGSGGIVAESEFPARRGTRIGVIRFSAARVASDVESCVDQIMAALARIHSRPEDEEP